MRILHCCLAGQYVDGLGYQETILARMHRNLGHEVEVVASTEVIGWDGRHTYLEPRSYIDDQGIKVTRIPYRFKSPSWLARKLRLYDGLEQVLNSFRPELLFVHDGQFLSAFELAKYAASNPARVIVDCHTDEINSARGMISRWLLHGLIYRSCIKALSKVADRFYATLPLRADFLCNIYGVERSRISLLPFGVDDDILDKLDRVKVRAEVRRSLEVSDEETILIAGGKMDRLKNVHLLLQAFAQLRDHGHLSKSKLLIFGKPDRNLEVEFGKYQNRMDVMFVGWKNPTEIIQLMLASDCAVFPGTHSVVWEVALGVGLPVVLRHWPGMDHMDWGENCIRIKDPTPAKLADAMVVLCDTPSTLKNMRTGATSERQTLFSYRNIARRSLERGFPI